MEKRSHHTIQFASLTAGEHRYDFTIDNSFFEQYEHSLIKQANVDVEVSMLKGINNLQFTFTFDGDVRVTCVRCLDEFDLEVNEVRHLMVRQIDDTDGVVEEEEDIISIPLSANEIRLDEHIYDYLNLMVPVNPVHPDKEDGSSGCNQKVLDEMNKHLGNEFDKEDPRWEILKKLKLK